MKYKELKEIVYANNPDALIGLIEGQYFDSKSQPYFFNSESVKHEYAKDLVSFLNADGGFILLGGKTEINVSHSGEDVSELRWFPSELFSLQQYRSLIVDWIYPEPEGVEFVVFQGEGDLSGKMLCVLDIPNQKEGNKPYLIAKSLLDENGRTDHQLIGWAKRVFDGTTRVDRKDIHKWIQSGQSFEERIVDRLDYLSSLMETRETASVKSESLIEELLDGRIQSAIEHLEATDQRVLTLALYPGEIISIPRIFESRRSPVANLMTDPPRLRDSGWDVRCGLNPRIVNGEFLRNGESDRRVLDVYADGTTVFAGMIHRDLLAWGDEKNDARIHPLALPESIWGVCAFYQQLVEHFSNAPQKVIYQLKLSNMRLNGRPSRLPPHSLEGIAYKYGTDDHEATDDECYAKGEIQWDEFEPAELAYAIVKAIYLWFEFTEAEIPYVKEVEGKKMLDTAAMIARPRS